MTAQSRIGRDFVEKADFIAFIGIVARSAACGGPCHFVAASAKNARKIEFAGIASPRYLGIDGWDIVGRKTRHDHVRAWRRKRARNDIAYRVFGRSTNSMPRERRQDEGAIDARDVDEFVFSMDFDFAPDEIVGRDVARGKRGIGRDDDIARGDMR